MNKNTAQMKKTILNKSLKVAVIILLCGLTLVNLFTIATTVLGVRGELRWLPCAFLEVESGSMEPEISAGDLVFVWETPYEELQPGDIISYHSGTGYITHKIIRAEGQSLVTKGTANRLEDEPIGKDLYYARVRFVIPAAGILFNYFSDPVKAFFEILIIISLFYGYSAIQYIVGKLVQKRAVRGGEELPSVEENSEESRKESRKENGTEGAKPSRKLRYPVKFTACLSLVTLLATSPCMTAAKYVAMTNEFFTISSSADYFTSNLLSSAGDHFSIKGWTGSEYNLVLETKNYINTLLFNREGTDMVYALYLEPVTGDDYKSADYYSLQIFPTGNVASYDQAEDFTYPVDEDMYLDLNDVSLFTSSAYNGANLPELAGGCVVSVPFIMDGSDDSGQVQDFTISVRPSEDPTKELSAGDKICFNAYAFTRPNKGFYQVLTGQFTMEVASSGSFLSPPVMSMSEGSLLIKYRIMTNLITSADSSSKTVLISWDASKVYLNEYEPTAFNQIYNTPGNNYVVEGDDGLGRLTMTLEAYSSVELQFFRNTADTVVSDTNISAAVLENGEVIEGSLAVR